MSQLTPLAALRLLIEEQYPLVPVRDWPLVALLNKKDAYQKEIKWNVNVGGAAASGRATDSAGALAASSDTTVPAKLSIGDRVLGHRFDVLRNDIVQARAAGVGALRNLFGTHIQTGFDVVFDGLDQTLYTGTGTAGSHGVYGMEYATDPAEVSYAGISSATHADWEAYRNDNAGTGRNLSRSLMGTTHAAILKRGGNYNVIITSPELVDKYEQQFASEASTTVNVGPQGAIDMGFGAVTYKGRPIIPDRHCPAGTMYFVRTNMVYLHTFNLSNSDGNPNMGNVDPRKVGGLNFLVAQLNNENPHVMSFELSLQPQLQIYNRRKDVSVLTDLNQ